MRHVLLPIAFVLILTPISVAQIADGAGAQIPGSDSPARPLSSFLYGRNGFRLQSLSISGGHYLDGIPNFGPSGSFSSITGSASMGWAHIGERSNVGINYSPSYTTYVQFPELSASGHSLSFKANKNLSQSWNMEGGITGQYSSAEQLLFTPTVFRTAASTPASFDELANSLLNTTFTNDQLASMLTGSPIVEVPSRQLLFGDTVVSASGHISLAHSLSGRASFNISAAFTRLQPVSTGRTEGTINGLLGQSTSGNVGVGISYSLSPRTQVGASVNEERTISRFQDSYQTSGSVFIGRKMSRRWFGQVYGGAGHMRSARREFRLSGGPQYQGGGSIGFRTYSHTLLFSSGRTFGDRYGIGAGSTITAFGSWNWARPGRSWTVFANVAEQWFRGGGPGDLSSWQATMGVAKALTSTASITAEYAHTLTGQSNLGGELTQRALRFSIVWAPHSTMAGR
jgi:hypothetical protein